MIRQNAPIFRLIQEINYPILWGGRANALIDIDGLEAHPTRVIRYLLFGRLLNLQLKIFAFVSHRIMGKK
jgi:hypothetical protein